MRLKEDPGNPHSPEMDGKVTAKAQREREQVRGLQGGQATGKENSTLP